jgi:hypothetical protein
MLFTLIVSFIIEHRGYRICKTFRKFVRIFCLKISTLQQFFFWFGYTAQHPYCHFACIGEFRTTSNLTIVVSSTVLIRPIRRYELKLISKASCQNSHTIRLWMLRGKTLKENKLKCRIFCLDMNANKK